jgi:hypothetical protein
MIMEIEIKSVLYLNYIPRKELLFDKPSDWSDDMWVEKNRPLCKVGGCGHHGEKKYDGGFYVLCFGHRKLARDIFNGIVPPDYVPSSLLSLIGEYPLCSIPGCLKRCQKIKNNVLGEQRFSRYCDFHKVTKNRYILREPSKDYTPIDYSLPLPDMETRVKVNLPTCEVEGCGNPVHYTIVENRPHPVIMFSRCKRHRRLQILNKPDNYIPVLMDIKPRGKCIVEGCGKSQANKGIYRGQPRYDLYCEKHRRGRFKVERKIKKKQDKTKCSVCGWKGPCDSHRILRGKDGGKYVAGNVVVLCPNCHRLAHRGLLIL